MSALTAGDHRAYTLKPHWAHAIAHLGKRCENRTTPIPKGLVGRRVAIHAGAALPAGWMQQLEVFAPQADRQGGEMASGAFVATAVLAESIFSMHASQTGWCEWGIWDWPVWWRLEDVRTLTSPVPVARGAQGPWRLTPEQVEAINAQGGGL